MGTDTRVMASTTDDGGGGAEGQGLPRVEGDSSRTMERKLTLQKHFLPKAKGTVNFSDSTSTIQPHK